jgi:hypothetical protein
MISMVINILPDSFAIKLLFPGFKHLDSVRKRVRLHPSENKKALRCLDPLNLPNLYRSYSYRADLLSATVICSNKKR